MDNKLKEKLMQKIEKEYDNHDVVNITIAVNKFANKVDVITEKRERFVPSGNATRGEYNRG